MGFSHEWERLYLKNKHNSIWPWSDLVSYVMCFCENNKHLKVLELGCGVGANIPFFKSINAEYYAIDGSITAIEKLKKKFPYYKNNLICGDFTKEIGFENKFDLIFDRAALTHNSTNDILQCLQLVAEALNRNGKFIGIHWFSNLHSEFIHGDFSLDNYTKQNFQNGAFFETGQVHFSDKEHLLSLFEKNFEMEKLEHLIKEDSHTKYVSAMWNFVARNKALGVVNVS